MITETTMRPNMTTTVSAIPACSNPCSACTMFRSEERLQNHPLLRIGVTVKVSRMSTSRFVSIS